MRWLLNKLRDVPRRGAGGAAGVSCAAGPGIDPGGAVVTDAGGGRDLSGIILEVRIGGKEQAVRVNMSDGGLTTVAWTLITVCLQR